MATVPATVRNAFLELLNDDAVGEAACQLAAQLIGCADVLPFEYCEMLDVPAGTTFGQAAQHVRTSLGCSQ
ncbi:MAG TPA: hypothetical protein VGQ62_04575 [Chloroflexota bacterium]|jgi:hypothetical protein|nr:hypothetical protein [Chloroflexota bacterium]